MTKIKDIEEHLAAFAPPSLQESYDNAGLITGDRQAEVAGILVAIDCTEPVVEEAVQKGCNLIIAHHPIIFRGIKKLTGTNYVERTLIKAIQNNIAIYAIHTNLDNILAGVNFKIAEKLGLEHIQILKPTSDNLLKLTTFIPKNDTEKVLAELHSAGAGMIGNYKNCSFRQEGTGAFLPDEKSNPSIGQRGTQTYVTEDRVEVILPAYRKSDVLRALKHTHPYEEVAYYLSRLENENQDTGAGIIGQLAKPMDTQNFLSHIQKTMQATVIRHTAAVQNKINTVALCGGSGSFLLKDAIQQKADIFITADFKYHEFFDADGRIMIADIGHYESEQFTKELIYDKLTEKFANIALHFTDVNTNPIFYKY